MSQKKSTELISAEKPEQLNWRSSAAIQRVFETVPTQELIRALLDTGNDNAVRLAERLSDDAHGSSNLALHCAKVKMVPRDVWNILIESRKLETRLKISEGLVAVGQAIIEAATPQVIKCPKCKEGMVPGKKGEPDQECGFCAGVGSVIKQADKDSQKLALEIGEMIGLKGPMIAQQFNYGSGQPHLSSDVGVPDMADWSRSTDSMFEEHTGPVEEAEIV